MSPLWFSILCAISLCLAVVSFLLARAYAQHSVTRLRTLLGDVTALSACQAGAAERDQTREQYLRETESRLEALEQRLRQIARRQDEQHHAEPGEPSYGAAIRLAHQGADVDQLVTTFGLARGEAELIAALHRTQHAQHMH